MNILLVDDERLAVEVMNRMIDKEKWCASRQVDN